jgi:hypothetical protein
VKNASVGLAALKFGFHAGIAGGRRLLDRAFSRQGVNINATWSI